MSKVKAKCDECGSTDLTWGGYRRRKVSSNPTRRMWFHQRRCRICGKIFIPVGTLPITNEEHEGLVKKRNGG